LAEKSKAFMSEKSYTHEFRLEMSFTVPHCQSPIPQKSLKDEKEWILCRLQLALAEYLTEQEMGSAELNDILFHEETWEEDNLGVAKKEIS